MEFIIEIEGNLSEYTKFFDTEYKKVFLFIRILGLISVILSLEKLIMFVKYGGIIEIERDDLLSTFFFVMISIILPVICGVIQRIKRKVLMLDGKVEISFCENSLKLLYLKYGKSVHYPKKYVTYVKRRKDYYKIKIGMRRIIIIYKKNLSDQSICKIEEWICKV